MAHGEVSVGSAEGLVRRARTSGRSTFLPLLVLSCSVAWAFALAQLFGPLQELVKFDLNLSDFDLSLVVGVAAALPVALLSIPVGRLVDRGNRIHVLIGLALVWTGGGLLTAVSHGFAVLFFARTLAGMGMMLVIPVVISLAADLCAVEHRGRVMFALTVGRILGTALAFALGGAMVGTLTAHPENGIPGIAPWRNVMLLFAAASGLFVLPLLALREPVRRELAGVVDPSLREAWAGLWQRRRLLIPMFLGQVTVVMADVSAGAWAAPILQRDYHQLPAEYGPWMGLVILLSGLVGAGLGGVLADYGSKGKIPGGILGGAMVASFVSIPAACFAVMPTVDGFAWMLALLLVCGSITGLVTSVAISVLLPNELRGVALGAFVVIGSLLAFGIAPTLVTLIAGVLGGEGHLREGLTVVTCATSIASALGFVSALRSTRQA